MHSLKEKDIRKLLDDVCDKYSLSKTHLSLILGWGAKNLYRYYNGAKPNLNRLKVLLEINKNPYLFMEYLEKNKGMISEKAYKKSKKSVQEIIGTTPINMDKIRWILSYFLSYNKELSPMGLKVLFYYSHGFAKTLIKKEVTYLKVAISKDGIVYPQLESVIEEMCSQEYKNSIEDNMELDLSVVTILESTILEVICKHLMYYSNPYLKKIMYENEVISVTSSLVKEDEIVVVNSRRIEKFFEKLILEYEMSSPEDIGKYIKKLHKRNIYVEVVMRGV